MERNIIEHIEKARRDLDYFNWEVAHFRAEHGMDENLVWLYAIMGQLDKELLQAAGRAKQCYDMFSSMFKELQND